VWWLLAERHSGRGDAANPESNFQRLVFIDSARRFGIGPGMTAYGGSGGGSSQGVLLI
jgi:hypothetical protein